jgi:hypothetical protein
MNEYYLSDCEWSIGLTELDPFSDGFWWEVEN